MNPSTGQSSKEIAGRIVRLRKICLVHRYIYYVAGQSLVDDPTYDGWERELRRLVEQYPDIAAKADYDEDCPSRSVGSSLCAGYPRELQMVAESLLIYNPENFEWWAKVTSPEFELEIAEMEAQRNEEPAGDLFSLLQ